MQGIAPFHIQAGQIEHRLPVQSLCRLTRQINDFFVIAVFHENFRVFHGARFEKPVLRLRIDGWHLARLGFTDKIRDMRIEKRQALVAWQDFFRVVRHFAGA
ncbi:hypothetical protein CNX70_20590 [Janthinobacterium svalbardensis]|uniref:Uncharacterized protein n=1 Tax=Janthinobacterium svalbardensis TaxID=368607 RepID=A0A290WZI7_9BURK|nr:hypothetical protein CNX70_20590 [Janthinobacterium svalbardensis]